MQHNQEVLLHWTNDAKESHLTTNNSSNIIKPERFGLREKLRRTADLLLSNLAVLPLSFLFHRISVLSNAVTIIVEMPKNLLLERVQSAYHSVTI